MLILKDLTEQQETNERVPIKYKNKLDNERGFLGGSIYEI